MTSSNLTTAIYELSGPRELILREEKLDLSNLPDDTIVAQTLYSVISPGTEVAAYTGAPPLRPGNPYPRVIGYCNVAEVVATGKEVDGFPPGSRFTSFQSHRSAFICRPCDVLSRLAPETDPIAAATTYLFHLGYQALLKGCARAGLNVAVVGLGTLGLGTVAAGKLFGCRTIGLSGQPFLRQTAVEFGADTVFDKGDPTFMEKLVDWSGETGIDLVVTTSNDWEDWRIALTAARVGGTIVVLGFPGRGQPAPEFNPLDSQYLYDKQLTITSGGQTNESRVRPDQTRFTLERTYPYLLDQIEKGRLPARNLVTEEVPWQDLGTVYERMVKRESRLLTIALDWT